MQNKNQEQNRKILLPVFVPKFVPKSIQKFESEFQGCLLNLILGLSFGKGLLREKRGFAWHYGKAKGRKTYPPNPLGSQILMYRG